MYIYDIGVPFGLKKCSWITTKRRKVVRTCGIVLQKATLQKLTATWESHSQMGTMKRALGKLQPPRPAEGQSNPEESDER